MPPRVAGKTGGIPKWVGPLVILLAGLVCYLPALRGGFIWDDDAYVTQNGALQSLSGLSQIWFRLGATPQYYPLVFSSFWIEYHLWGLAPLGYHLDNILLHLCAALLFTAVLRRLEMRGALLAGFLFAVHPVAVESVAWITERKNVLSTVFYLLGFLALLRAYALEENKCATRNAERGVEPSGFGNAYVLALVFYICALLAKTVTCSLPIAFLLVLWWKRGRITLKDLRRMTPFIALGLAFGLLTVWMEKAHVGAQGAAWHLSLIERGLVAGRAVWFYLGKLIWPAPLIFSYPRWHIDAAAGWQYLFPLSLLILVLALWFLRRRIGRGPLAALLFFVITLFPALGFINVFPMQYSFVADHFQYLAMLGPIALAAALAAGGLERLNLPARRAGLAACGMVLVVLGGITWRQGHDYRDLNTLWTNNLARNPHSWMMLNNQGCNLSEAGSKEQALAYFDRALQEDPRNPKTEANKADALAALGQDAKAQPLFEDSIRQQPDDAINQYLYGRFLTKLKRLPEAERALQKSVDLNPSRAEAHADLATVQAFQGRADEALNHYQIAMTLNPRLLLARGNMAKLLSARGRGEEAFACLKEGVRINPGMAEAHSMFADYLIKIGRNAEAAEEYRAAARLNGE